jgi:hypothetical protein
MSRSNWANGPLRVLDHCSECNGSGMSRSSDHAEWTEIISSSSRVKVLSAPRSSSAHPHERRTIGISVTQHAQVAICRSLRWICNVEDQPTCILCMRRNGNRRYASLSGECSSGMRQAVKPTEDSGRREVDSPFCSQGKGEEFVSPQETKASIPSSR